jgi:TP901 family phage tail tape measure protein
MAEDFKIRVGVTPTLDETKIQSQINSQAKNIKINAELNLSDMQRQINNFAKTQKNALNATFDKNSINEYTKLFDKAIKTSNDKAQIEIKKTAKAQQDIFNLSSGKTQLTNNISSYLSNNSKLSSELRTRLTEIQIKMKDIDSVGLGNLKKEFQNVKSEANALGQTGDSVFTKLGKNVGQFLGFLSSATLVMSGVNAIKNMVTEVKNLDAAFISLRKVTDETEYTYRRFLETAIQSSQVLGSSVSDMVEMTATWAKLGYTIQEASELAKTSTIYANVADINDTEVAVSDLVTAMKAYGISAKDAISIADRFNEIGNKYATDAASLGDGLKNAASSLSLAGNSIDESLAMLTSMTEITQNASESGNALKVLAMRIRGMKGDLEALDEESDGIQAISKIQTQILNLTSGKVNIFNDLDPTKFKSTYDIMLGISKVWADMSEVDQAQLLEIVAGKQRGNSIAALIQSMSQAENVLQTSLQSSGSALLEQQKYMEGIQYSADKLKASFQGLASDTLNSEWVKTFYELANVLVNVVDKIGLFNIALVSVAGVIGSKTNIGLNALTQVLMNVVSRFGVTGAAATALSTTLSTMIPAALIIGGVTAAIAAYDHFNVTLEENQEKLSKQKSFYDSEVSNIQSLTSELASAQNKLEELNNVGGAVVTKDGEQEKLKAQTDELQRQLDIAKETQRIAGVKAENTATETLSTKVKSKYVTGKVSRDYAGYDIKYDKVTRDVELARTIDEYNKLADSYKNVEMKQQDLANAQKGTSKEYKNNKVTLDLLSKSMANARTYANELATSMQEESSSLIGATTAGDSIKNTINNSLTSYESWLNLINDTNTSLNETSDSTSSAADAITALTQTTEDINKSIDSFQSSMKTIQDALQDTSSLSSSNIIDLMQEFSSFDWSKYGVTGSSGVGDLTGALKGLAKEQYNLITANTGSSESFSKLFQETIGVKNAIDNISSSIDSLSNFNSALSSLDSAYSNLSEKQSVTIEDIQKLNESFGETSGFDDFINTISSAKTVSSDVQSTFDNLVTSYLNSNDVLGTLDDSNKNLIITQLKHIGIINAEELVTQRLSQQEQILAETGVDVKKATAEEIIALINETNVSEDTRIALVNLAAQKLNVNNVALSTSGDIQNLLTLMSISNATTEALQALQAAKDGNVPMSIARQGDMQSMIARAQAEVDAYYKSLSNTQANVNYSGGTKTQSKKSGGSKKTEFSNSIDWADQSLKNLQNAVSDAQSTFENTDGYKAQVSSIKTLIEEQKKLKAGYKEAASEYKSRYNSISGINGYKKKIESGETFSISDFSDEKLYNKVKSAQDLWNSYQDTLDKVSETTNSINENTNKKFELTVNKLFDDLSHSYNMGKVSEDKYYNTRMAYADKYYKNNVAYQDEYRSILEEFYKWQQDKLKETIEKQFDLVDTIIGKYNDAFSSINNLASKYDDGSSQQMQTYAMGINKATEEVKYLTSQIAKLNTMKSNGAFKDDISVYNEQLAKLEDALFSAKTAIQNFQESLSESISAQKDMVLDNLNESYEKQTDEIQKQSDSLKEIIESEKELLDLKEKQRDYELSISQKLKDISKIESRMAELRKAASTGDRQAQAELNKLNDDLSDKKENLAEEQHDHEVDLQKDALDKALTDNEKLTKTRLDSAKSEYDDKVKKLNALYDKEMQLIASASEYTKAQFSAALSDINTQLASLGVTINPDVTQSIIDSQTKLSGTGLNTQLPSSTDSSNLVAIKTLLSSGTSPTGNSEINKYVGSNYGSWLNYSEMAQLAKLLNVSGIGSAKDLETGSNRMKLLEALKKAGFKNGGTVDASNSNSTLAKMAGEDGLALVRHNEEILTPEKANMLRELLDVVNPLKNVSKLFNGNVGSVINNSTSSPTIQFNLTGGNITQEAMPQFEKWTGEIVKQVKIELLNGARKS